MKSIWLVPWGEGELITLRKPTQLLHSNGNPTTPMENANFHACSGHQQIRTPTCIHPLSYVASKFHSELKKKRWQSKNVWRKELWARGVGEIRVEARGLKATLARPPFFFTFYTQQLVLMSLNTQTTFESGGSIYATTTSNSHQQTSSLSFHLKVVYRRLNRHE